MWPTRGNTMVYRYHDYKREDLFIQVSTGKQRERGLRQWLGPLCLPMLLVLQPLTDYNLRTCFVLIVLSFSLWFHHRRRSSHKQRPFVRGLEKHCDKCDRQLVRQIPAGAVRPAATSWFVRSYRKLPLRLLSRHWGALVHAPVPSWLATICIWIYAWLCHCRLDESERPITEYKTLGEFFCRRLRRGVRPISAIGSLVSPADGTVTYNGEFQGGFLQQVKGVHYSANYFLGLEASNATHQRVHASADRTMGLMSDPKANSLYQMVIYLAPGDYHRFHSPTEWTVTKRRHFPGELLSVKRSMTSRMPGLMHLNERVSWMGHWRHGFFSLTAVGATNVGSIHASFDPDLRTNCAYAVRRECTMVSACSRRSFHFNEKSFEDSGGVTMNRGDEFGHFSFGSSIVLLFEAPRQYNSAIECGQKIRVGQALEVTC